MDYPRDLVEYLSNFWSARFIVEMIMSLRKPCRRHYIRVNTLKTSRDSILAILRSRGFKVYPDPHLPDAIYILTEGPFKIPELKFKIIVDKRTAESVMIGANVYAPGVIKVDPDARRGDLVNICSPKGDIVAYGRLVVDSSEVKQMKKGLIVETILSRFKVASLRSLPEWKKGYIYEQSFPAILTSHILDPKPDEIIVDMCAAPGGKTTHIAQLLKNEGVIYAFDKSESKIRRLKENIERLGVRNVKVYLHDSRYIHIDFPDLKANKILLDPPCTALGVRPKVYEDKNLTDMYNCAEYQKHFIKAAYNILKRGGILVYSTCTYTFHENELNMKFALELGFKITEEKFYYGARGVPLVQKSYLLQRFYPNIHDTPAYFIAVLVKS